MNRFVICTDPVPYSPESKDYHRQLEAEDAAAELAADLDHIWLIRADLYPDLIRRFGPRNLPHVHDLISLARRWTDDPSDWIGYMNSDIVLTPKFFAAISELDKLDVLMVSRTDLDHIDQDPEVYGERLEDGSTDILFARTEIWDKFGQNYPDYILGEPAWGYGARAWARRNNLRIRNLDAHECLHIRHFGVWKKTRGTGKGYWYNRKLYVEYIRGQKPYHPTL